MGDSDFLNIVLTMTQVPGGILKCEVSMISLFHTAVAHRKWRDNALAHTRNSHNRKDIFNSLSIYIYRIPLLSSGVCSKSWDNTIFRSTSTGQADQHKEWINLFLSHTHTSKHVHIDVPGNRAHNDMCRDKYCHVSRRANTTLIRHNPPHGLG